MNRSDWNLHADEFETTVCDIVARETNNQIAKLVGIACKSRKDPILVDLGCGLGSFIKKFSPRFAKIFAFDFAARIVTRARRRCARVSNAEWFAMDISRAAKVIGNCADLTVCLNVVTARSSAKRRDLWMSIYEVTRPLGFALIVVPSIESQKMVEVLGKSPDEMTQDGLVKRDGAWQKFFTREEFSSTLSSHGFEIRQLAKVYYPWRVEGLRKPRLSSQMPWDWICLAQRTA